MLLGFHTGLVQYCPHFNVYVIISQMPCGLLWAV